jgi:glycosyltransferase involved in cell wall biosynthesis
MRVLHFYKTSFPDTNGGVEQVIHQLARGGEKVGIQTDVLSLTAKSMSQTFEADGYTSHRARLNFQIASTGFSASAFSRFSQLAKKADVIHYHFPWPFMDLVHFATRIKKPTVVTYHSDIIRQKNLLKLYRPLMHRFLSDVDRIVVTSPNYLATSDVVECFSKKTQVIPIGLDKASYPVVSSERLSYWRNRVGGKFFLFVGVLRYYKGLHILIEAAVATDYPIVIVGAGPIEHELKKQVERLGVRNIIFLGYLEDEDKVALFTLCYSVVFPSHLRSEAFGVSLLEGAMYRKPMISAEIGTGTTFININQETGLVVPPSNPTALREAMGFLWNNPAMAAEMAERAEARYAQYFSADNMLNAYAKLYSELV